MTDAYVQSKIKEALAATSGDKRDAQKLLITWAVRDQSLLLGLSKPHLKAIISAQIDHASRPQRKEQPDDEAHFSRNDIDRMLAKPHVDKRTNKAPPPKSSDRQASVMHQIADAFRKRRK